MERNSGRGNDDKENMANRKKRAAGPVAVALRGRPSPAEVERQLREERRRRRNRRITQVREQSKEAARVIRERVRDAKEGRLRALAAEELDKYRQEKEVELAVLEEEYQRSLADMGVGHEAAREHEKYQDWLRRARDRQCEATRERGMRALRRARERARLDEKVRENTAEARRSALLAERLRAALARKGPGARAEDAEKKFEVVEVDGRAMKKVTLVSKKRIVLEPPTLRPKVRRVPLSEVGNTGFEAAAMEHECERRAQQAAIRSQMEAAKRRGDSALQKEREKRNESAAASRAQQARPNSATASSSSAAPAALSTIHETTEPLSATATTRSTSAARAQQVHWSDRVSAAADVELDLFPVRGPSSSSFSSSATASPETKREQDECRVRHSGSVRMGGPTSAFTPVPRPPKARDGLEDVRELIDIVERQKRALATVGGIGTGAKNDEADRNFVASVLGVPPETLAGEKVRVRVNVEEVSTFEEDEAALRRGAAASSSGSDIARERFITRPLRPAHPTVTEARDQSAGVRDFRSVKSLIGEMREGGRSERSIALRGHIEALLEMRRDEIDDLSVSTISLSEGTVTTTTMTSSAAAGSSLSSPDSFVASTPASILSNSGRKSSSSSGGSKTVRFIDDVDGSFRGRPRKSATSRQEEEEEEEIAERTRTSIAEVRRTFEEKKRGIELALAKRFEKKLAQQLRERRKREGASPTSSSAAQLSEGPLSDSTREEEKAPPPSGSSSSLATNSTKESSLSSSLEALPSPPELASMLKNLRHSWAQSMLRRARNYEASATTAAAAAAAAGPSASSKAKANKSSSSGTTTTSSGGGSQAVAELRERLARLEMPSLPRPPQLQPARAATAAAAAAARRAGTQLLPVTTSTSDDTFARVAEILSEEVAPAEQGEEFSSFHFSPDDDDDEGITAEREVSFVSLSTNSEHGT